MSAVATFRTAVAALLYDTSNAIFTTTEIDQALVWALSEYSRRRPLIRSYTYDVDTSTKHHTLPADFVTNAIVALELYNDDPDAVLELGFYAALIDEQWLIETHDTINAGEVLTVYYSDPHSIDGLASAAGTTLPLTDELLVQVGAAGHAAQMRAVGTIETINMNTDVAQTYKDLAREYLGRFVAGLEGSLHPAVSLGEYPEVSF